MDAGLLGSRDWRSCANKLCRAEEPPCLDEKSRGSPASGLYSIVFFIIIIIIIIQSMRIIKSLGVQRAARRICTCCANTTAADLLPPL